MNALAQLFASNQWTFVVEALLHTLWLGAIAAVALFWILRGKTNPVARHRWCLAALSFIVIGGIIAWAILQHQSADHLATDSNISNIISTPPQTSSAHPTPNNFASSPATSPVAPLPNSTFSSLPETWTPWLALIWLVGVTIMLVRAGSLVTHANQIRRHSTALENATVSYLVEAARRKLNLARRIQVRVTDQLISPAVMGILTPVLILPASLLTTLPANQLEMILLHELAHIRRGDYLINLLQLLIESLLFFNPAVWWISRQIRQEREACCDALAIACAGERLEYAQTLAEVAGHALEAAPAFADERNPSGLKDRIQRLLVPGYRPAMRVTWFSLALTVVAGGGFLVMSALGTRAAVAAILSPQQRIARIEKKMAEIGQPDISSIPWNRLSRVMISGHVRSADGSLVPENIFLNLESRTFGSSGSSITMGMTAHNGEFQQTINPGEMYISVDQSGFAPVCFGPFNGFQTNSFTNIEIVLDRGFDVAVQIADAESGRILSAREISLVYWNWRGQQVAAETKPPEDPATASMILEHCADLPLNVAVNAPGYEITGKSFLHVRPNEPLKISLQRGKAVSGTVVDKVSGRAIANAEIHLRYQTLAENTGPFVKDDPMYLLGKSDAQGVFTINRFRPGIGYDLAISAHSYGTATLDQVLAGQSNLVVKLGPKLIVRGHFVGSLKKLPHIDDHYSLDLENEEVFQNSGYNTGHQIPLYVTNGIATFVFTNDLPGKVTLAGQSREIAAPVDDWVIDTTEIDKAGEAKAQTTSIPTREVIFRFKYAGQTSPQGLVTVNVPDDLNPKHLTARDVPFLITNGEVHVQIPIGGTTSIEPGQIVGYWFDRAGPNNSRFMIRVTNGVGPLIIEIPLLPAGAIFAHAVNPDGTVAGGLFFGLNVLKRAHGVGEADLFGNLGDSYSGDSPRHWVSGPLPLGGTYQVYAWRGNTFCLSDPIKLTGANPDADLELKLPQGEIFQGIVLMPNGQPLANSELKISFMLKGDHSFTLNSVFTDEQGRFGADGLTPKYGTYFVQSVDPRMTAEKTALNFKPQPQIIRLKAGHVLGGRIIQKGTGYPIPGVRVNVFETPPVVGSENQIATTDADGWFKFTTLTASKYSLFASDVDNGRGLIPTDKPIYADGRTNLIFEVKLSKWSNLQPKTPASAKTRQ